ncbi:phage major capsid protein [Brucepastera parasyntrophica]|uniref:phage major capsid protein n=1 Tax=Brucepastera parasyntrophica TaxID=2880008 RepID=UPI00210E1079|nr:phage major capsid protein [Brucepastera parasyntrophica]ULQ59231.1 phage major capsid protein [Brucepastera parasyntrophica]
MNLEELKAKRAEIMARMKGLKDGIQKRSITAAYAKEELERLRTERTVIDQQIALITTPRTEGVTSWRDIASAMIEKRAITLNGTGSINQIKELVKIIKKKTPVLDLVRYFYGPNASTNIPVWNPTVAKPGNYAEGATNIPKDTNAVLSASTITPYAYVSLLQVSAETLMLGQANLEAELPEIFADAFADAMHEGLLIGDGLGRNMAGLFPAIPAGNQIACGAAGTPLMADIVKLALTIQDKKGEGVIILNQNIYTGIMADPTTGVADLYKEELIRSKTVEGIKVILTSDAPNSITAGSVVAVAGDLKYYGVGVASEILIEPKKQVGDTNTYFEASMWFNGKAIIADNFFGLVTV